MALLSIKTWHGIILLQAFSSFSPLWMERFVGARGMHFLLLHALAFGFRFYTRCGTDVRQTF